MTSAAIAYTMTTTMALHAGSNEIEKKVNLPPPIELFDWIANKHNIRGSKPGDLGVWLHTSAKPVSFCPLTRVVVLEDGNRFLLQKKTICKALGLDKMSEQALAGLVIT
jgi:hypothetical protein